MWWFLFGASAALIVLLMLLVLLSKIRIRFFVSRVDDNDFILIDVRALNGLVKYKTTIPTLNLTIFGIDLETENSRNPLTAGKPRITKESVIEFYENAQKLLSHVFEFRVWVTRLVSSFHCRQLRWETQVGLGDAPNTAITTGAVWALKTSILGYLNRLVPIAQVAYIQVYPLYNRQRFTTELEIQADTKVATMVSALFQLLFRIMRVKGGLRVWSKILRRTAAAGTP